MIASAIVFLGLLIGGLGEHSGRGSETPGLVADKPGGRSVRTDFGYMVPYTQRIPGTEITFRMEPIPGGRLLLGSPNTEAGRRENEGPQRVVTIAPMWVGRHEVTWAEFRAFMDCYRLFRERSKRGDTREAAGETAVVVTSPTPIYDLATVYEFGSDPEHPAVAMTQYAAKQYTKWLSLLTDQSYRLPTEAEWEYAARAGSRSTYFFGDNPRQLAEYAWFAENADDNLHHVGLKQPNQWGLCDVYGNVAEFTLDGYAANAYGQLPAETTAARAYRPARSVRFPHVVRGGLIDSPAGELRSAARGHSEESWQDADPDLPQSPWWNTTYPATCTGFRVVRPLKPITTKEQREEYWSAAGKLADDVAASIEAGRGIRGSVDRDLVRALVKLYGMRKIRARRKSEKDR